MLKYLVGPIVVLLAALMLSSGAQAQSSYKVRAGDTLQIEVVEDASLNRTVLVLPDGSISVPLVGSVPAAGRTVDELRSVISSGLASNFVAPPSVFVAVAQIPEPKVVAQTPVKPYVLPIYILGEVAKPGKAEVVPGTTLLQFLAESGGMTKFAATKRIQLRRTDASTGTEKVYRFNYRAVLDGAAFPTVTLQSGDVIIVPQLRLFE
jgi:polysaccharide export outer membrane protein